MAIHAGHSALAHRVMVLEHKLGLYSQMAGQTCLGLWSQDITCLASSVFHVQASRAMAGLAGLDLACLCVFIRDADANARVLIELEVTRLDLVAIRGGAGLWPDVFGPWDGGQYQGYRSVVK